jgi:hypothetical protein
MRLLAVFNALPCAATMRRSLDVLQMMMLIKKGDAAPGAVSCWQAGC